MSVIFLYYIMQCVNKICIIDLYNSVNQYFPNHQGVKLCLKDPKCKTIDFNVIKQEKFVNMASDSVLQITFKKVQTCQVWGSISVRYPQLSENSLNILSCFSTTYQCEARFSSCSLTKTYLNKLNAKSVPCQESLNNQPDCPAPSSFSLPCTLVWYQDPLYPLYSIFQQPFTPPAPLALRTIIIAINLSHG